MPFTVVILICSMALERSACQPNTAIDVVQGPKVENEHMCAFFGQTTIAGTAVAPRPGEEYTKIICSRSGSEHSKSTAQLVQ